jgi:AraC-like DNA-binding protein
MMPPRLIDANRLFHEDHDRQASNADRHPWHELVVCEGVGYAVEIDGVWHEARPGMVFYHPPGSPHRARVRRGAVLLLVQWSEAGDGARRPRRPDDPRGRLASLATWLLDDRAEHHGRTTRLGRHLLAALAALLDEEPTVLPAETQAVRVVLRHLRYHYGEALDLAGLARLVHLSPWHLLRRFKAETGQTPMACLRRIRLEAAADLLRASRPFAHALAASGYGNARALARALRRATGHTPAGLPSRRQGHELAMAVSDDPRPRAKMKN